MTDGNNKRKSSGGAACFRFSKIIPEFGWKDFQNSDFLLKEQQIASVAKSSFAMTENIRIANNSGGATYNLVSQVTEKYISEFVAKKLREKHLQKHKIASVAESLLPNDRRNKNFYRLNRIKKAFRRGRLSVIIVVADYPTTSFSFNFLFLLSLLKVS